MTIKLRGYQEEAVAAYITWMRKSLEPALIDAAPASGKSFMIAAIADYVHTLSGGKKILCIAPSKELVQQNHEKYLYTGNPASIFSASAGRKCTRHPVIYGTPGTIKNGIKRIASNVSLVVFDECHEWGATNEFIVKKIREVNPNVRVLGLSGTPFRTKEGYIYRYDPDDELLPESVCTNPYFAKCVYQISPREVLEQGNLCPMKIGDINAERYDTSMLSPNPQKKFSNKQLEQAFVGHGRKTASIVADVVDNAQRHPGGVMLFASTVRHAEEILASLPPGNSGMVTGDASKKTERAKIVKAYKEQRIRYLVSVGTLTTGFDAPWTSIIAVLRKMESPSLLQQIMGRAWRPWNDTIEEFDPTKHEAKEFGLLLDYAGNMEDHFPDGDIYQPEIKGYKKGEDTGFIPSTCPSCGTVNQFNARQNKEGLGYDEEGYFTDLEGHRVMTDSGPMPGHYGRRCGGMQMVQGEFEQCNHRWTSKKCPECDHDNDIAARYCKECKAEIIDPNEKLIGDFKRYKRDPTNVHTDVVSGMVKVHTMTRKGDECLRIDYTTEYRSFAIWYYPESNWKNRIKDYKDLLEATNDLSEDVKTVTYKKDSKSGFFKVFGYNNEPDTKPDVSS